MLEANSNLTWRDVQHILVYSSSHSKVLKYAKGLQTNGAGLPVDRMMGYGLVNAGEATRMAERWVNVPRRTAAYTSTDNANKSVPDGGAGSVTRILNMPHTIRAEHVMVSIDCDGVGVKDYDGEAAEGRDWMMGMILKLTSPDGTVSILQNGYDIEKSGVGPANGRYTFHSVQYWGEQAQGNWTLEILDGISGNGTGILNSWSLEVSGTSIQPQQPASISNLSLSDAKTRSRYRHSFQFDGISNNVKWKLSGGVPAGLKVAPATGKLFGKPRQAGTYSFYVEAESSSPPARASKRVTLKVLP
jgi:hypothetical protein